MLRMWAGVFVAVMPIFAARAAEPLESRIETIINAPEYKQAHWGILVVDAKTGETVYEHDADKLFAPASTTKLYSCAAALATFGPDHKFETPVYRRGPASDSQVPGDLILVASGDLTLGGRTLPDGTMAFANHDHIYATAVSVENELTKTDPLAGLNDLARQIHDSGVRKILGDVLIDDRLFPAARGSGSGPELLTPIVVNDNLIDLIVSPGREKDQPAEVKMRPETSWVHMDCQVATAAKGATPFVEVVTTGPHQFTVRGRIAALSKPLIRIWPVDEPTAFARALFIESLRRNGVTVKVSHNLYASTLPLLIAQKHGQGDIPAGLRWQRQFLHDLGVPVETISFGGGAGGANSDCTSPRATVKLIQEMSKRKDYAAWHAGLPILGVDGTLDDVVSPSSPAKGKVHAKTGTLSWYDAMNSRLLLRSKALAGTATTADNRELFFAMFVNDVPLAAGVTVQREGKVMGKLCEAIYECRR